MNMITNKLILDRDIMLGIIIAFIVCSIQCFTGNFPFNSHNNPKAQLPSLSHPTRENTQAWKM